MIGCNIIELIKKCGENGYSITRQGLYIAGYKFGFFKKTEKGMIFDEGKFNEWLEMKISPIPENYMTADEIANEYNMSLVEAYSILKDTSCKIKTVGRWEVICGERESVERIIEFRGKRNK